MSKRDSFIFYRSFFEAISDLPEENQLLIYKSIAEFSLNFKEIDLKGIESTIFKLIKPQLEANNKRFKNGTAPKNKAKQKQNRSKIEANNNVNDNVNKNNNKNKEVIIPDFESFKNYALEKSKTINVESLKLKYDSWIENNWKDGNGNKIKNWKSKLLNTIPYLKHDEQRQKPKMPL